MGLNTLLEGEGEYIFLAAMTQFRPCIDLHHGRVKQIVGGTLDLEAVDLVTNFESDRPASYYADLYKNDGLRGGHVIKLGPGNDNVAKEALAAFPHGLQVGGAINADNAFDWLDAGASHIIVTSWLFDQAGCFQWERLSRLVSAVGAKRLVIDLSCRAEDDEWVVAMDRWQKRTDLKVDRDSLNKLANFCDEFLIHAADIEGKCEGIDEALVSFLGEWSPRPVTYAGGANSFDDLEKVHELSGGRVDLTIGSALDIFGGKSVSYSDCVAWNRTQS